MDTVLEMLFNLLRSVLKPEINCTSRDLGLAALHLTSVLPPESCWHDMGLRIDLRGSYFAKMSESVPKTSL